MKKTDHMYRRFAFIILISVSLFVSAYFFVIQKTSAVATYSYVVTNLQPWDVATNVRPSSCPEGGAFTTSNLTSPGDMVTISGLGFGDRSVSDNILEMLYLPVNNALKMIYRAQRNEGGQTIFFGLHEWLNNSITIEVQAGQGGSLGSNIILRRYDPPENLVSSCARGTLSIVCSSVEYSDWGSCQSSGTQTRSIVTSFPNGCYAVNPVLSQSCVYTPPTCTSFTYFDWGVCSNGQQIRSIASSSPSNCTGGTPILTQPCTPACTANDYSCEDWSSCAANGTQTRLCTKNSNCEGGVSIPPASQICTYIAPTCTTWTYSDWGVCAVNGQQTRTVLSSSPAGCAGGNPSLTQNCTPPVPVCTADTWSCVDWSSCSADNLQTRTCTKTFDCSSVDTLSPSVSQRCTYTPPTPTIAPIITSISPDIIEKGTAVTLRGDKFMNLGQSMYSCFNCKVLVNEAEVSGVYSSNWTDNSVIFSMPSNATSGYVQVKDSKGNISEKFYFSITTFADLHPLIITSIFPSTAMPEELITVTGSGFGDVWYTDTSITVGGIDLKTLVSWSDTKIELLFPIEGQFGQKVRIKKCKNSWSTDDDCVLAVSNEIISQKKYSDDLYSGYQWYLENINAPQAWQITQGSNNVVVAVIDSGVDTNHEDLTHSIWLNQREIENNGIDDDRNGYIDDKKGWNFADESNVMDIYDDGKHHHGTMVAGLVAAKKDNRKGVAGIAPNVKIMPLIVVDLEGNIVTSRIIDAIKYAVENGANIINLSLGGMGYTTDYNPAFDEVVKYAYDHNVLVIAAAGNGTRDRLTGELTGIGQNLSVNRTSPVCNDGEKNWVIGVGATNVNNEITRWSNYTDRPSGCIDVWAPGEKIATTTLLNEYVTSDGTSFSAPIISGVAALVKSLHPDWNVEEIKTVLLTSQTNGIIDAYKAVTASRPNVQYKANISTQIDIEIFENINITTPPDTPRIEKSIVSDIPFPDVEESKYQEAINILKDKGIVNGYPDGTFRPLNTINRAEFLAILMNNLSEAIPEAPQDGCGFTDVKSTHWFAKYVCFAKSHGFAKGYPDGTFRPGDPVNFVEALALTERVFGWQVVEDTQEWFRPYVIMAGENYIIPDSISTFGQKLMRQDMAELVVRMLKYQDGSLADYLGTVNTPKITYDVLKNINHNAAPELKNTDSKSQIEVIAASVRIRTGIGYSATILENALRGQRFEIVDEKDGWYQIIRTSGGFGWIEGKWVKRID